MSITAPVNGFATLDSTIDPVHDGDHPPHAPRVPLPRSAARPAGIFAVKQHTLTETIR